MVSLLTLTTLLVLSFLPAGAADEFPGKGNKADWERANEFNDRSVLLADSGEYDKAVVQARKAITQD